MKKTVECPKCGKLKTYNKRAVRPHSTGLCRACYLKNPIRKENVKGWKGGRSVDKRGYVYVTISTIDDETVLKNVLKTVENRAYGKRRSGRVYLHHIKMIEKVGRPLEKGDVVHHIDGNPSNNDIANLELTNVKEHHWMYKDLLIRVRQLEDELSKYR